MEIVNFYNEENNRLETRAVMECQNKDCEKTIGKYLCVSFAIKKKERCKKEGKPELCQECNSLYRQDKSLVNISKDSDK